MATADEYADWIVNNADKKGTPEFDTVAQAYEIAKGDETPAQPLSRMDKVIKGLRDPIDGGAQLLTNILPDSVVNAGNAANNWLADKTGLVGRLPEGGVSQQVQEGEKSYQAQREQTGETGIDGYRLLGNLVSPANLAIASKLPAAASIAGRVGVGAAGGAATAALAPVVGDDYGAEKTKQIATGALFGGAVPVVTGGVARVISPNASRNPQLSLLKNEGVKPTIGQSIGGAANRLEERLQSVPFLGDSIAAARQRSGDDLSRAAANRALFPLGKSVPKGVQGNDAVLYVRKALGDAYDDIAPKLGVTQDPAFKQSASSLQTMVKQGAINPQAKDAFNRFIKNDVNPMFQGANNSMSGETFKRLQSKVTEKIQQTAASTDADQRLLNGAYKELGEQLNNLSIRTNPQAAAKLKAINTGYANFKRLQKAASSVAAEEGKFTPAMLHNAVKAADRSKDKARFAEGGALMQDLSSAGKTLLSNKVPNSGTPERLMAVGSLGGLGYLSPTAAMAAGGGLLGGAAMYTPFMQQLMSGAVSARPLLAQPASEMLRKAAPALVPGGAQFGLGLLN